MSFAPVRLGNTVLEAETAAADRNSCRRFGPCGVGEKALYLNDLLIDRHFYVGFGSVRRVFKRVAMSQGGFSGKGAFGSIPYLVVQYDDGQEKQCTFKREEDVDELLAYLGQVHPEIPRLSVGGEQRLAKKAQQEASRYLKELTPQAQSAREELERARKFLSGYPELTAQLAAAAKAKRINEHTNPAYRWVALAIVLAVVLLIRSHILYARKADANDDPLFRQILRSRNKQEIWQLLCEHIRLYNAKRLQFVIDTYRSATDGFITEHYSPLRRGTSLIDEERKALKRQRRREIVSMRRLDPLVVMQRNTWYFLGINSCQQMLYGLKRINDPIREHVGNSFNPMPDSYRERFFDMRDQVVSIYERTLKMLLSGDFTDAEKLRSQSTAIQRSLSDERKHLLDHIQEGNENLTTQLLVVHIIQESQELIGSLRHMIRGMNKFAGNEMDN